ncbi:MAG: hypothetical protein GXP23_05050 [Gammaproteobacteria bacterium]|nr:hypothetical protein [Gammaproteobacteria bacterium]
MIAPSDAPTKKVSTPHRFGLHGKKKVQEQGQWAPIWNKIANPGMPLAVSENIIYRDLLLEYARKGGYNISGSQWNVDNMSLFGKAPWYHRWDWGRPIDT